MIAVRSCTSRSSSVPSHAPPSSFRRQETRIGLLIPSIISLRSGSFPSRLSRNSIRSHCGAALKRSTLPRRRDSGATAIQSIFLSVDFLLSPGGAAVNSQGRKPLDRFANQPEALEGRYTCASFPQILLVVFDLVPLQQRHEFVFEIHLSMMIFLTRDVCIDRIEIRKTDRKRSIPGLPAE